MRIIPVIDLQGGLVVHAVAGQRQHYRPLQSSVCASARPGDIAQVFRERFDFPVAYVADLDALEGHPIQWAALEQIRAQSLRLILDAGVGSAERFREIEQHLSSDSLEGVVVALEAVEPASLTKLLSEIGPRQAIFSLDLQAGALRTRSRAWRSCSPLDAVELAVQAGFQRLIVLDLAYVGTSHGLGVDAICRQVRERYPDVELITGGGVRDRSDLERLARCGCDAALVATALHRGLLDAESIRAAKEGFAGL